MKSKLIPIIFLLTVALSQNKQVIAVSDVKSEGLSKIQQKQFFDKLESELVNLRAYEVTSRSEVDKILEEQKFQKSGCTDQQCAAEIGRLLNADLMLLSNILYDKDAGEISVSLKLVDVETAKIVTAISKYEAIGKLRHVFDNIPGYLLELYRNQNKESSISAGPIQGQKQKGKGTLTILSDPIGANIVLDNKDMGLTPFEEEVTVGKHRIIMTYEGYERFAQNVKVEKNSKSVVEAELVKLTGDLTVISEPTGGDIYINDEFKGQSPLVLQYLDVGSYFIKIVHEGYVEELTKTNVEWNKENILRKTLKPLPSSIALYSVPVGAEVFINSKSKGYTSISGLLLEVPSGKQRIKMKMKGYITEKTVIELKPGETTDLELSLSKLPEGVSENVNVGWISIKGTPKTSEILLDGKQYNSPLKYHELEKGNYSCTVSHDGYKSKTASFKIKPQKHTEHEFMLSAIDRKKARKLSLVFPGLGHMYAEKIPRGIVWMALEMTAIYSAVDMLNLYNENVLFYNSAKTDYLLETDPDQITNKFHIYETANKDKIRSLLGTAGLGTGALIIWIWNVYDVNKAIPSIFGSPIDIGLNKRGQLEASIAF